MIAELGQFALALALAVSLALGVLPMLGSAMRGATGARLMAIARPAALALMALAVFAF